MAEKKAEKEPSKEEQIGFHKGAISTLLKEREEMFKIIVIVYSLLRAHIEALGKLGVQLQVPQQEATSKKK